MSHDSFTRSPRAAASRPRTLAVILLGLLAGCAAWFVWLSWGFDDRAYSAAQVVGCGLSAVIVVVALTAVFREVAVAVAPLATAVGLTAAWTIWAAGDDETGLFAVGAIMLLVGSAAGLSAVAGITRALLARRSSTVAR